MIITHAAYMAFCAALTGGVATYWIGVDSWRLRKALRADRKDAVVRDQLFGSSLGILVGIVGVVGVLRYYL